MTHKDRSLLIRITLVLLVATLCGCGAYLEKALVSNETSAISGLKGIYYSEQIKHNETKKYVPLDQLFSEADAFLSPSKSNPGYRFEVRVKEGGKSFEAVANPVEYNKTGRRSFYMNEQGVIHGADKAGGESTSTDPEVSRVDR
jgi:hypothetical protein